MLGVAIKKSDMEFRFRYKNAEKSTGFLLWQVTNDWQHQINIALRPLKLTQAQFVLLAAVGWLDSHNVFATQKEVSIFSHIDVMTTSQVLRRLEGRKLIMRKNHPSDIRAYVLSITREGSVLLNKALEVVEDTDGAFFRTIGIKLDRFTLILKQLSEQNSR